MKGVSRFRSTVGGFHPTLTARHFPDPNVETAEPANHNNNILCMNGLERHWSTVSYIYKMQTF